jgi:hypothetical protein
MSSRARSIVNCVAIFPEEDETTDAPEHPDAIFARFIKWPQQTMERQAILDEIDRHAKCFPRALPDQSARGHAGAIDAKHARHDHSRRRRFRVID